MIDLGTVAEPFITGIVIGMSGIYAYLQRKVKNITTEEAEAIAVKIYTALADGTCNAEEAKGIISSIILATK